MQPHVTSETGVLRKALLCRPHAIDQPHDPINRVQQHFYEELGQRPDGERVAHQHERLANLLAQRGVDILWAKPILNCPEQHFTRDVAMVIGETFIVNNLKEEVRHAEIEGLAPVLDKVASATTSVDRGVLEGGDVLIHGGKLFVGMGARTDHYGREWLTEYVGTRYPIVPIPLASDILHLDVAFNIVGEGIALIYPPALSADFVAMAREQFTLIEVTTDEQFGLATNVVSLSPETVIADERFTRVNGAMRAHGLEVLTLPYDEVAKMGGSLRCTTCPLIRDNP